MTYELDVLLFEVEEDDQAIFRETVDGVTLKLTATTRAQADQILIDLRRALKIVCPGPGGGPRSLRAGLSQAYG